MRKIDKILQYIDKESLSMSEFERMAGMSNGYLKNTVKRRADVTQKILDVFREKSPESFGKVFPELNGNPEEKTLAEKGQQKSPDTMPELIQELLESQRARIKLLEERQQAETRLIQVEQTLKIVVEILHGLKLPEHARTPSVDESTVEVAYRAKNVNKNESTGQKADRK